MSDAFPPLAVRLVSLLDDDAKQRRFAVEGFSAAELADGAVLGALRRLVAADRDVAVRAAAAEALGRADAGGLAEPLLVAMDDASPVVRDAAIRAVARRRCARALAALGERAGGDAIWWVRRAALYALGVIAGTSPREARAAGAASPEVGDACPHVAYVIEVARGALSDPFWRVRHAAVQVLAVLGRQDRSRRDDILADVEGGSADYLRALWGPTLLEDPRAPAVASRLPAELADRDPAVVTARLLEMAAPPALALVELLSDPHVALRELAVRRLLELGDAEAFAAALRWLDEPRIPHVAATVIELLDGLGDPARALAEQVLAARARVGASRWAIGWAVAVGDDALAAGAWQRAQEIGEPELALPLAPEPFLVEVLRAAAAPAEPSRLALAVAEELLLRPAAQQQRVMAQLPEELPAAIEARLAAIAPLERVARGAALGAALGAVALARLAAAGCLTAELSERAAGSEDPEVREAVLAARSPAELAAALASERDPWVRRSVGRALAAAARRAVRPGVAPASVGSVALELSRDLDPLLRVEGACLLDPRSPRELARLFELISDPSPAVQSALFEPLAALGAEELAAARAAASPAQAAAIDLWLQAMEPDLAERARPEERAAADDVAAAPAGSVASSGPRTAPPRAATAVAARALGRTGVEVSPLSISGAFELSSGSLYAAFDAGVDSFFWEPTYPALARFLRGPSLRGRTKVITGSYHADAASIEKDVHRALRRLRRDTLDVFLLFWARSPARLDEEAYATLDRLRRAGHLRAVGFSTHDRALAKDALARSPWDVVMTRHSAAHPGIEEELLPYAASRGASVITFSALCYGRMVTGADAPTPADCYRYSLSQPGVATCLSAPRRHRELVENLEVLASPTLDAAQLAALRRHGEGVRLENQRFGSLIRQPPRDAAAAAMALLEAALPPEEGEGGARSGPAAAASSSSAASLGRSLTAKHASRRLRRGRL